MTKDYNVAYHALIEKRVVTFCDRKWLYILAIGLVTCLIILILHFLSPADSGINRTTTPAASSPSQPIVVKIFYEIDCPHSRSFFRDQLRKILNKTGDKFESFIDLRMFPYGKAEVETDGSIRCQHGEHECEGNTAMACADHFFAKNEWHRLLKFMVCFMSNIESNGSVGRTVDNCDKGIADTIRDCSTPGSSLGKELLGKAGAETRTQFQPKPAHVPWFVIQGDASKETSERAEVDLAGVLCDKYDLCLVKKTITTQKE